MTTQADYTFDDASSTRHPDHDLLFATTESAANSTSSEFRKFLYGVATPVIFTCISLIGVIGNSLVIYVIVSKRSMRTVTNLLLLNLAIADLCFVVIVPPFTAYQQATSTWPFGDAVCKLLHYLVNVTAYVTVYTLVLISVIRYMTVVHSVRTAGIRTRQNVVIMVTAIWVVVLLVNVPILMSYGVTDKIECEEHDDMVGQRVFTTFFAFAYLVPLAVIAVFSIAILRHITSQRAASMIHQQQNLFLCMHAYVGEIQKDKKSRSGVHKVNVSRLLILVIVIFALLWLPVHIHLLLAFYARSWIHETDVYQTVAVLCTCLAYFNSCVNPIIYNRTSKEFRDAFREAVGCIGGAGTSSTDMRPGRSRFNASNEKPLMTQVTVMAASSGAVSGDALAKVAQTLNRRPLEDGEAGGDRGEDTEESTQPLQPNGNAPALCQTCQGGSEREEDVSTNGVAAADEAGNFR